ncbi:MAG TPA: hypothetical protein VNO35_26790 [Steroidobacteraceae bacterium]|nr:hypothetical protein [Steroidobacteraceae bacterium]
MAEIYDRYDYAAEKTAALEACSRTVLRILRSPPSNVVPLRKAPSDDGLTVYGQSGTPTANAPLAG